jgi:predicted esterase
MRRYSLFLVCWLLIIPVAFAQIRYLDELFTEVNRSTHIYATKPGEELKMDIFQPKGDSEKKRPVLLYVHGGGFAGGQRDSPAHVQFCEKMARKGYITATMSYTLVMKGKSFSCDRPAPEKINTFLLTARDISRATKFLLDNQQEFQIDQDKIILLGSSAGAEAILHAAFWKESYKNGDENILSPDFSYGGIVSMAGAITSLDWITTSTAIPSMFFHGTCDNLVPYDFAPHHYCLPQSPGYLMLYGGHAIAEHLRSLGQPYTLVTGCYGGHEWNITPIREHLELIVDFLYTDVLNDGCRQIQNILVSANKTPCENYNSFKFCQN